MFKKIGKFEGVVEIDGRDFTVGIGDECLTFHGIKPEEAMALLHALAKVKLGLKPTRGTNGAPKARTNGSYAPVAATGRTSYTDKPSNPPQKGEARDKKPPAERSSKEPPLPTPAELKAKESAKAPAEPKKESKPPADEAVAKTQEGAFVEDLSIHQAVDAAKLVTEGKAQVPAGMAEAKNLNAVIGFMNRTWKIDNAADMVDAVKAWHPHVPYLRDKVGKDSLKGRVTSVFEAYQEGG